MDTNTTTQFSTEATNLWNLQNEATAAEALATLGTQVSASRHILRQRQAEEAGAAYKAALDAASPELIAEYCALLKAHAAATK